MIVVADTTPLNYLVRVRGTLGILERGAKLGKTDVREASRKLERTNFRLSNALREEFLRRNS